ncbi:MAG: helix-turn-helix transcriptional regulator [Lachnospiraceae bacterium]|nr:helix-turn-helix transcriptional regulator [Lachnospiraceae bacterium]
MIYHRIRDLREDRDMTQTELSKLLHITQRAYSHYENGTRDIPLDILISIADFHDVSIDYLLNRTNDKKLHTLNTKGKI